LSRKWKKKFQWALKKIFVRATAGSLNLIDAMTSFKIYSEESI